MNLATAAPAWRLDGGRANVEASWLGDGGLSLRVAQSAEPTVLRIERAVDEGGGALRLVVELLPGAECVLVESHAASGTQDPQAQAQVQVELELGELSHLDHVRLVRGAPGSRIAHDVDVRLAGSASYVQRLLASGGASHLQRTAVDLGCGASSSVSSVLLAAGAAMEQQVRSRHAAPDSRSSVELLALGSGNARISGDAYTSIAPGCDRAAARQRLSGIPTAGQPKLVLRPHLEIHHDDVEAVHGATWGALPEDALFHARQRGLDEQSATAIIVEGLARAVLARDLDLPAQADVALSDAVHGHLASAKEPVHG